MTARKLLLTNSSEDRRSRHPFSLRSSIFDPQSSILNLRLSMLIVIEQLVEQRRVFFAAVEELLIEVFVFALRLLQFIGDVQRGQDRQSERIRSQGAFRYFAHPLV